MNSPVNARYEPRMTVVYRPEIVAPVRRGYSRSPCKPALWMEHVRQTPLGEHLDTHADFEPVTAAALSLAHTRDYVSAFLTGKPHALAESSGNGWSPEYRDSVLAKVGALLAASEHAVTRPERIVVCPTSGDHHARPSSGGGFCPIAGQVIAGLKLYRSRGIATAWIDTDEHYGNAIPDAAAVCPEVRRAIPFNINPAGSGADYLASLERGLARIEDAVVAGSVGLVCVGHGADSHEWDDLGGSVTTAQWLETARRTYAMLARASDRLRRPVPLVTSFFGGYRDDHYASVLDLHVADVAIARDVLAQTRTPFLPRVSAPQQSIPDAPAAPAEHSG